jgi:PPK2 family polyphosphate:nucleotide phosphotransferase
MRVSDLLRLPTGAVDLHRVDPRATPGMSGGKQRAAEQLPGLAQRLATRQEQLYAEGRLGGHRSVLLVLQGMDTSGKGGTARHVVGLVDPSGVHVAGFSAPTPEEASHDFLWRIRRELPRPGRIGAFDRSHYEDVVTVRVLGLVDEATIDERIDVINRFEEELVAAGTVVVKCFLHISTEAQRERLLARLDDPTKHWKFSPGDLDTRERWEDYITAYEDALARTSTEIAPWHVIPADRKWYRNWAVTHLLVETFDELGLSWPEPDFDLQEQRARLLGMP